MRINGMWSPRRAVNRNKSDKRTQVMEEKQQQEHQKSIRKDLGRNDIIYIDTEVGVRQREWISILETAIFRYSSTFREHVYVQTLDNVD